MPSNLEKQFLAAWRMCGAGEYGDESYPDPLIEYQFHETRRWRFDFAWPSSLVAVEVDGGIFMPGGGRHNRGVSMTQDAEKTNVAAFQGWSIVKITDREIKRTPVETCYEIARLIRRRGYSNPVPFTVQSYGAVPHKAGKSPSKRT